MIDLKYAAIGLAAFGAVVLGSSSASSMPNGLPAAGSYSNVENVRMVCNAWGRCWWRPNYYVSRRVIRYDYLRPRYRDHGWAYRGGGVRW